MFGGFFLGEIFFGGSGALVFPTYFVIQEMQISPVLTARISTRVSVIAADISII